MYGRIHYENEDGEFRTLDCPDQKTYETELEIGCKWIEAEPRRPLGMWGERFAPWTDQELIDLAFVAIDNAVDDGNQTFESELEFQLNAPEHRGRPPLTAAQVDLVRAIWRSDERTSLLNPQTTSIQPQGGTQ